MNRALTFEVHQVWMNQGLETVILDLKILVLTWVFRKHTWGNGTARAFGLDS